MEVIPKTDSGFYAFSFATCESITFQFFCIICVMLVIQRWKYITPELPSVSRLLLSRHATTTASCFESLVANVVLGHLVAKVVVIVRETRVRHVELQSLDLVTKHHVNEESGKKSHPLCYLAHSVFRCAKSCKHAKLARWESGELLRWSFCDPLRRTCSNSSIAKAFLDECKQLQTGDWLHLTTPFNQSRSNSAQSLRWSRRTSVS